MTKPLPFTESAIARAVAGATKGGMSVGAVKITANGSIIVLDEKLVPTIMPKEDDMTKEKEGDTPSPWDDIEA